MDKQAYFEMCEMLGTEPLDEEIPLEIDDFPELVQKALHIYAYLPDIWEGMSGTFMGKDLSIIPLLFNSFKVEEVEVAIVLDFISTTDNIRKKNYRDTKAKAPKTKSR